MTKHKFLSVLMLVAIAFAASMVLTGRMREANEAGAQNRPSTPAPAVNAPIPVNGAQTLPDFSRIAERTIPVVVNISAKQTVRQDYYNPLDRLLYGRSGIRSQRGISNAVGSGVIVSPDGYILTNNHVVTGEADQNNLTIEKLDVTVTLSDKRELPATLIGTDPATDLALLKIDATRLPTMPWADSSKLKVAEWVLAIGNPYQLSETVTLGIVSAVGRTNLGVSTFEDFIQTDAAINPGNSGGALVDVEGRLIGINTAILSRSGGNQGIGFAIPSNMARDVMEKLVRDGKVTRGYVGLMIQDVTPALARQFNLKDNQGALVGDVIPKGPADKAGVKSGDVVLEFAGKPVRDSRQFRLQVARTKPGERLPVKVLR
ncbi:MAG TPA: trypsin-like peptidase domain-containing protein, partial [Vicinamibacterales bacterium]|nr:trypsin-like peptidase domain-containing protein [Vicinamibacterales bacterium]